MKTLIFTLLFSTQLIAQNTFQFFFEKETTDAFNIVQLKTIELENGNFYSLGAIIKGNEDGDLTAILPTISHLNSNGELLDDTIFYDLNFSYFSEISYDPVREIFELMGFELITGLNSVKGRVVSISSDFDILTSEQTSLIIGDLLSPLVNLASINGDEKLFSFLVEGLTGMKLHIIHVGSDSKIKNSKVQDYDDNYTAPFASNGNKTYVIGENAYMVDPITLDLINPKQFDYYDDYAPILLPYKSGFVYVENLFTNTLFILDENLEVLNSVEIPEISMEYSDLYIEAMTVDQEDNILLVGDIADENYDYTTNVIKYDSELNLKWNVLLDLNLENDYYFYHLAVASDKGIILSGEVESDSFVKGIVLKITPDGLVSEIIEFDIENSLTLYPNPSKGDLSIIYEGDSNPELSILDIMGKQVYQQTRYDKSQIDISALKAGIYFVELFNNGQKVGVEKWTKL